MSFWDSIEKGIKKTDRKIKKIRRSDEKTKRNWLVGSTIVAMIVVLVLWVGYLNVSLPQIKGSETEQVEENVKESDSFLTIFSRGLKKTAGSIKENIKNIIEKTNGIISNAKERFENVQEYNPEKDTSPFISPE